MQLKTIIYEVVPVTQVDKVLFLSKQDAEDYQQTLTIASTIQERKAY